MIESYQQASRILRNRDPETGEKPAIHPNAVRLEAHAFVLAFGGGAGDGAKLRMIMEAQSDICIGLASLLKSRE